MTWREIQSRLVWALDRPATRILFGVVLPLTCFALLRSLPLLVFALTICAAMTWSILLRTRPGGFVTGALCASVVPCLLGQLFLPVAAMGVLDGLLEGDWKELALALLLAPLPAAAVYARELLAHWRPLAGVSRPKPLPILLGLLAPFALGLGLALVMNRGVARSVRRIADERVPLRAAVESAERWSWATGWGSLAHGYGRSSGYTGWGPWPDRDDLSKHARRSARAYHALTGEVPERALARRARYD